ncbi:MAG: hypothetical protein LBM20_02585 [Rikenellaceae bacterium]|jgi:hypothetical protein|nr:hypothetical protein [Rikenellaceae bacterium]
MESKTYGNDRRFIEQHLDTVEIALGEKRVLTTPSLQGRVVTSTTAGEGGYSFGWINYALISSGKTLPHCNNFGGEDRFWLGPEGGQHSLFFRSGSDFSFDDWQTPAVIDTEAWAVTEKSEALVSFRKEALLQNYGGTPLALGFERRVRLLDDAQLGEMLPISLPAGVDYVAFESENRLTNRGDFEWNRQTGMPSIWILGQFTPSDDNTIIIPVRPAADSTINDAYFGKIPADRLRVTDTALYYTGDGRMRGKIGIPPAMTLPLCGALDRQNGTLTLVRFSFDPKQTTYVNSMWEHQDDPFRGDVINAYNDGPLDDGSIMGPFYELETSSPAANLRPGQTLTHRHTTIHFKGELALLEQLAKQIFSL